MEILDHCSKLRHNPLTSLHKVLAGKHQIFRLLIKECRDSVEVSSIQRKLLNILVDKTVLYFIGKGEENLALARVTKNSVFDIAVRICFLAQYIGNTASDNPPTEIGLTGNILNLYRVLEGKRRRGEVGQIKCNMVENVRYCIRQSRE